MTPQNYPQGGGGAAGRGIVIVGIAIVVGVYLLARAFSGAEPDDVVAGPGDEEVADDEENGDSATGEEDETGATTSTTTTTTTTTLPPPVITHAPNEVRVAAVNGTGAPGLAGAAAAELSALGFQTRAKNAVSFAMTESMIYYQPGYTDDAKAIAASLSAPLDILTPAPATVLTLVRNPEDVSDFHIFVVLAADGAIPIVV